MRKRTKQVFITLDQLTKEMKRTPTIRQIARAIADGDGDNILSDVFYCLQELRALGLVGVLRKPPRGIYIPIVDADEVDWEALMRGGGDEQNAKD